MKPTANAAMTVVSAWAWASGTIGRAGRRSGAEAGEVLVEAPRVGRAHRRPVVVAVVVAVGRPAPAPARKRDRQRSQRRQHSGDRDEVRGELEAVVLRGGEDRRPVARDELGLD